MSNTDQDENRRLWYLEEQADDEAGSNCRARNRYRGDAHYEIETGYRGSSFVVNLDADCWGSPLVCPGFTRHIRFV